jgi:hypothetical protein
MAFLKKLTKHCQECSRTATVEVFGPGNRPNGRFCSKHGQKRYEELLAEEGERPPGTRTIEQQKEILRQRGFLP